MIRSYVHFALVLGLVGLVASLAPAAPEARPKPRRAHLLQQQAPAPNPAASALVLMGHPIALTMLYSPPANSTQLVDGILVLNVGGQEGEEFGGQEGSELLGLGQEGEEFGGQSGSEILSLGQQGGEISQEGFGLLGLGQEGGE